MARRATTAMFSESLGDAGLTWDGPNPSIVIFI